MTAGPSTSHSSGDVLAQVRNGVGVLTLNRPKALNALSLPMLRDLTGWLLAWQDDPGIRGVLVHGATMEGRGIAFCAGGDIRFFHQAALAGDPRLEDFFTEEYALNHLIHVYRKPYVAWMDGVVMGGGMGISQGASVRIVTERTRMAMPETNIGLFPDVGGGWFLAHCPGHVGEYLALSGAVLGAGDAIAWGLADVYIESGALAAFERKLDAATLAYDADWLRLARSAAQATPSASLEERRADIDRHFGAPSVPDVVASLRADGSAWAQETLAALGKRSPLMLCVSFELIRRARRLSLADDLRLERDLMRNCFHLRPGAASEAVEGVRALAIDKDHAPRWNPATLDGVTPDMMESYFRSPWPSHAHPLRTLA
jgi:enoyl-CoA hydratase/carnithine racemase